MHCKQWIFDMDGTLTDSMVVVWEGAPEALLARFGRTPKADLHETLLTMGMEDGAQYLIREYALPLRRRLFFWLRPTARPPSARAAVARRIAAAPVVPIAPNLSR